MPAIFGRSIAGSNRLSMKLMAVQILSTRAGNEGRTMERDAVSAAKHSDRKATESTAVEPGIRGASFLEPGSLGGTPVLTEGQRQQLLEIATRIRVPARTFVYREQTAASWIYINTEGVLKTFKDLRSGRRWVTAFLFPRDVFGLAKNGLYVRTAQAITTATLYRIESHVLIALLRRDAELQFQFLSKVTHELREAQRQTIVVGRRDAVGRLAMFIQQLECTCCDRHNARDVELPMSRSDIASYLGLSLESVSRATTKLQRRGIVSFPNRHLARIVDRPQFDRLAKAL
ncbi:MAG TPA: Crp/Fnr family transcriptional regulator [Vicinamibacterales bacterium]|nr:Crp/Fnr family transcriptional regulator [Vicinamibacterales bacterium]